VAVSFVGGGNWIRGENHRSVDVADRPVYVYYMVFAKLLQENYLRNLF
jgi:hypothetical protein